MKLLFALLVFATPGLNAAPTVEPTPNELRIAAPGYRIKFQRYNSEFDLELRDAQGHWRRAAKKLSQPEFAEVQGAQLQTTASLRARVRHATQGDSVVVGVTTALSAEPQRILTLHFVCVDDGVLIRFALAGEDALEKGQCWAMPRVPLEEPLFDGYTFWRAPDEWRSGTIASLGANNAYAGVSAWGRQGDTAARLSQQHPAVIVRATAAKTGLGVVFLDYADAWAAGHAFVQRHTPSSLFLYSGLAPTKAATQGLWAWLAPFTESEPARMAARVEKLVKLGNELRQVFRPVAPEPDRAWLEPVPEFPASQRRREPVKDIREAAVYTVHETMDSETGIRAGAKVGSDLWIRAWFKWNQARNYRAMAHLVPKAHALGALFGGGITCSALYHGENGLTEKQVLDMATRGPDGQLVDAWGERNTRHGSLSNPAYLNYLLSWCRQQMDAGVDYLFMDEINAALQQEEGFDDYSCRDFRAHLVRGYCEGKGWSPNDSHWLQTFKVDPTNRAVCPDGTIRSFEYRTWLKQQNLTAKPFAAQNPLAGEWQRFRRERDDQAWKWLTDAIRAHARALGRPVLISGNGLARYVDLQVLGVWGHWRVKDSAVDLSESQLDDWATTVSAGRALAGGPVPVVFFHDWGFNGFPWMEVPPPERELWMRVRGAEIYAAGAFFAFPVHGPMGNDALLDGTIREVARQSAFYQRHKDLYLKARLMGFEPLVTKEPQLSVALWRRENPPALLLHVINRQASEAKPIRRTNIAVTIPAATQPKRVSLVSPDWSGEQPGSARREGSGVTVTLPQLEAYAVAVLDYDAVPEVPLGKVKIVPQSQWDKPEKNEFVIGKDGAARDQWALTSFLHGNLHSHLRAPPTFVVNMPRGGTLRVHVRAVATLGATLEGLVDGAVSRTVALPDRDRKNDSAAREYDQTFEFSIPPGRHRVTLRNVGGDWACISWYSFAGEIAD